MYSEENIKPIDPQEHVRLRPNLYFGGVDKAALYSVVDQILDEFIREALAGNTTQIEITLLPNENICISDNGSTIPVKPPSNWDMTLLEFIFTIHSQGHSGWSNGRYYVTGGNHGLGVNCANAVSSRFEVQTTWDGYLWRMVCEEGVKTVGPEQMRKLGHDEKSGTTITFTPDFTIFEKNPFDFSVFAQRAQELAYLVPGLTVIVRDQRHELYQEETFYFPDGLVDLVKRLNGDKQPLHPTFAASRKFELSPVRYRTTTSQIQIEFAFQYSDTDEYHEESFVNTVKTSTKVPIIWHFGMHFLTQSTGTGSIGIRPVLKVAYYPGKKSCLA